MDIDTNLDEFKNNRSTKIPQKEVDALMQELFDAYDLTKYAEDILDDKANNKVSSHSELEPY